MVGSATSAPAASIIDLLVHTSLMKMEEETVQITNQGFQFLLKDTFTQMWTLLLSYIGTTEVRNMDKKEVLSFLFQLSFLSFGKAYPTEGLSDTQQRLLNDLREFGLVWQRKSSSRRFYPTRLATTLATGGNRESLAENVNSGFIVLESNYRLYAYTSSELKISILSLFVGLRYRLPNVVVGSISRENIRAALMSGITAEQIISYLRQNAHPECKKIHLQYQKQ